MHNKHFSHDHVLVQHQIPEGTEIQCSGCKIPASGNAFACLECNFFLHEQCFRARRSLRHPSHPAHPLMLSPFPTYPTNSFHCDSCNQVGNGFSYCCSECEVDLHIHCALKPNPNPSSLPQNPTFGSAYPYYSRQQFNPNPATPGQPIPNTYANANFSPISDLHAVHQAAEAVDAVRARTMLAARGRQYALDLLDSPKVVYRYI